MNRRAGLVGVVVGACVGLALAALIPRLPDDIRCPYCGQTHHPEEH
ncbi:hypothetical protein SAMN04487819_116101 [Actinopolyspora alba]|uniref:Uncharacterized protein n=1 Tax=Actinopolyspora alba TaxID=673379 RepID=A0A1I2BHB1_9ACTN|nr:hypothetical protein [Actinopolyspora alba]SFE55459.1 hypothetical protein SAMN04487819_116101 [Actinopolyspora alba]